MILQDLLQPAGRLQNLLREVEGVVRERESVAPPGPCGGKVERVPGEKSFPQALPAGPFRDGRKLLLLLLLLLQPLLAVLSPKGGGLPFDSRAPSLCMPVPKGKVARRPLPSWQMLHRPHRGWSFHPYEEAAAAAAAASPHAFLG